MVSPLLLYFLKGGGGGGGGGALLGLKRRDWSTLGTNSGADLTVIGALM